MTKPPHQGTANLRKAAADRAALRAGAGPRAPESAAATSPAPMYSPDSDPWNDMGEVARTDIAPQMSADSPITDAYSSGLSEDEKIAADIARIRETRQPVGAFTQKLYYPPRRGYHRHWFNDSPGRVLQAKLNGWAQVHDDRNVPVVRHAGTGRDNQGMQAHLMEIPEVIWREDMDLRHRQAKEKVDALKSQPFRAPAGTVDRSDAGKMYSPTAVDPIQVVKAD